LNKAVNDCLKREKIYNAISNASVGVDKSNIIDANKEIDYKKSIDRISVVFHEGKDTNNHKFAEDTYEVIKVLKKNQIQFNSKEEKKSV